MEYDALYTLAIELQQRGARRVLAGLHQQLDRLDAVALAKGGPDAKMGPGPFEGLPCRALNEWARVILRAGDTAVAAMDQLLAPELLAQLLTTTAAGDDAAAKKEGPR